MARPGWWESSESSPPGPLLTVVVAHRDGEGDLEPLLARLAPYVDDPRLRLLVAYDSPMPSIFRDDVDRVTVRGGLTPHLWTAGLRATTTPYAVLTASTLCPREGWVEAALAACTGNHAVVGGVVEPAHRPGPGLGGWAVLFCRYTPHLAPVPPGTDPPGDNAVYRMSGLRRHEDLWADGFWEPFVHRALVADGESLSTSQDLVVEQGPRPGLRAFTRQRFHHGRAHGRDRARARGRAVVALSVLASPAVPVIMTARAARAVWGRGRLRTPFVLALPAVAWCYLAWAAGEALGGLDVLLGRPRP